MKKGEGEMGGGCMSLSADEFFFTYHWVIPLALVLKKTLSAKIVSFLHNDVLYIFIHFNDFIKLIIDFFF